MKKLLYLPSDTIFSTCFILTIFRNAFSFNVDVLNARIISGTEGSSFGYSVAFTANHRNTNGNGMPQYSLLVGAPRDNITNSDSLNRPGVVYSCDVIRGDCEQLPLNPLVNRNDTSSLHRKYEENQNDMMFGGALSSILTTDHQTTFLACGHKWINMYHKAKTVSSPYRLNGKCVLTDGHNITEFLPLLESDMQIRKYCVKESNVQEVTSCSSSSHRVIKLSKRLWDKGMAGFGAHLYTNTDGNLAFIVGTPGTWDWRGGLMEYVGNERRFFLPPSDVKTDSYGGYSVTSSTLFGSKILYLVGTPNAQKVFIVDRNAGYPPVDSTDEGCRGYHTRANHMGLSEVVPKCHTFSSNHATLTDNNTIVSDFASYFGASVCACDLDADGFPEVLVGAPQGHIRDSGQQEFIECGAVYVYKNTGTQLSSSPLMLLGTRQEYSRFGTSIAAIGDVNQDDFNDIAIGAPYEDEGRGCVYVYYGGSHPAISEGRVQRVSAGPLDVGLRGFGFSISGNADVDHNLYPDIAVGSYGSSQSVILYSRPVVTVMARVTTDPENIDVRDPTYENHVMVNYDVEWSMMGNQQDNIVVNYTISIDHGKSYRRGYIRASSGSGEMTEVNKITAIPVNMTTITRYTIVFPKYMQDMIHPVNILLTYEQHSIEQGPGVQPVLNELVDNSHNLQLDILRECGEDNACHNDLALMSSVTLPSNQGFLVIGEQESFHMTINIENQGEYSYLTTLHLLYSREIELIVLRKEFSGNILCRTGGEALSTHARSICPVAIRMTPNSTLTLVAEMLPMWNQISLQSFQFNLSVSQTGSVDTNEHNNHQQMLLPTELNAGTTVHVQDPEEISFTLMDVENFDPVQPLSDFEMHHLYDVVNIGPGLIYAPVLELFVPVSYDGNVVAQDIWVEINQDSVRKQCTKTTPESSALTKLYEQFQHQGNREIMDLLAVDWLKYVCNISRINAMQRVNIQYQSTLVLTGVEQFTSSHPTPFQTHLLVSYANVNPAMNVAFNQNTIEVFQSCSTLLRLRSHVGVVPMWIIILAVIGGFLILTVILVILKASGFFTRSEGQIAEKRVSMIEDHRRKSALRYSKLLEERPYMLHDDGGADELF